MLVRDEQDVVIDLGVLRADDDDEDTLDARSPGGPRWGRRFAVALAVAAVIGGATAAAPAPGPVLTQVAYVDGEYGSVQLIDPGLALVYTREGAVAYDVASWTRRWIVPGGDFVHAIAQGDVVILRTGGAQGETPGFPAGQTIAVDRRTGEIRWHSLRYVEQLGDLLMSYTGVADRPDVEIHDVADYRLRWRLPAGRAWVADVRRGVAWRLADDGELVEHDLYSGRVRRSARVPLPAYPHLGLVTSRGAVGVMGFPGDGAPGPEPGATWYDVHDFRPVSGAGQWAWESDCGGGLNCAYPSGSGQAYLVDAATGAAVRSIPDGYHLGSSIGLLLLGDGTSSYLPVVQAVMDPATGLQRTELKGWHVLTEERQPVRLLGRLHAKPDRTYFAELADDGLRRLGSVPYQVSRCSYLESTLLCATFSGDIAVWRVNEAVR